MNGHTPTVTVKDIGEYFEGDVWVPAREAYRVRCECGWRGGVWYLDDVRALRVHEIHVDESAVTA